MQTEEVFRESPAFTQLAFARLLAWLDDGVDSSGETYLEMRRRLVAYFDRRNRTAADELADETFNRIARTLAQGEIIATRPPARYCYVVARFVLLEDFRRQKKYVPLEDTRGGRPARPRTLRLVEPDEGAAAREEHLQCLDRCLLQLKPEQRELIIEYYRDTRREKIERRRALAARLGISMNALGIRACRIRDMITRCLESCRRPQRI